MARRLYRYAVYFSTKSGGSDLRHVNAYTAADAKSRVRKSLRRVPSNMRAERLSTPTRISYRKRSGVLFSFFGT